MAYNIAFVSVSIGVRERVMNTYPPTPKWAHYHMLQWFFKIMGCLSNFYKQAYLNSLISEAIYVMHGKGLYLARREKDSKAIMKMSLMCFYNINGRYFKILIHPLCVHIIMHWSMLDEISFLRWPFFFISLHI